jgi:hypothetical protein
MRRTNAYILSEDTNRLPLLRMTINTLELGNILRKLNKLQGKMVHAERIL